MKSRTKTAIVEYNMISAGETVCAALSGGADSVALLLVLHELSGELGFTLTAVHVNHLLRGNESERDERFCRDLCAELGVPLSVHREDAAAFSRSLGVSVETGARELRYRIFDAVHADKVATAHNLNDNAETILFRIARGTGLNGLAGIPPVRGRFIRPLLFRSRDEIERYLAEKGQAFVTDSTNLLDDYTRNRIRHNIMPEMMGIHGAFPECVTRMAASLAEDEDFLTSEAKKCEKSDLRTLHPAVRKRVIKNLLEENGLRVNSVKITEIEALALSGNGRTETGNGFYAVCEKGVVTLKKAEYGAVPEPQIVADFGEFLFNGDKIVIRLKETDENMNANGNVNKKSTFYRADYDKIQGDIVLRNRLRSDAIKPENSACTKELRKILQEKLPVEKRKISAVLADEKGLLWAEYAGVAERVKCDENTKKVLVIEIENQADNSINIKGNRSRRKD